MWREISHGCELSIPRASHPPKPNSDSFTSITIYLCKICIVASLMVGVVVVSPWRNVIRRVAAIPRRAQSIVAVPNMKSIGVVSGGQEIQLAFTLCNRSQSTVRIAGAPPTADASCWKQSLPFTINPGEEKNLSVWVVAPEPMPAAATFDRTVTLFRRNAPGQATLTLRITGIVAEHGGHAENGGDRKREYVGWKNRNRKSAGQGPASTGGHYGVRQVGA